MHIIWITKRCRWCSGWTIGIWPLGPGFESQVPQNLYFLFLWIFTCRLHNVVHHIPQSSTLQVACKANMKARMEWLPCSLVNARVGNPKKSNRPAANGPGNCNQHLPIGPAPPLSLFFFSFLSFYFTYLILILKLTIN